MALILKGAISFDKEHLPPYIFKFNIVLVCFFLGWFLLCLPPVIVVGCVFGEDIKTYATMIAVFAAFFIGLLIFCIVGLRLKERLIEERAAELEEEFSDMPLEEAKKILREKGIINEYGFIYKDDLFGETSLPFEKTAFAFGWNVFASKIFLNIAVGANEEVYEVYELDVALFNFLIKSDFDLSGSNIFDAFVNDKREFTEAVFKNRKLKKLLSNKL